MGVGLGSGFPCLLDEGFPEFTWLFTRLFPSGAALFTVECSTIELPGKNETINRWDSSIPSRGPQGLGGLGRRRKKVDGVSPKS